jgi:hypothetical protein
MKGESIPKNIMTFLPNYSLLLRYQSSVQIPITPPFNGAYTQISLGINQTSLAIYTRITAQPLSAVLPISD